MKQTIPNQKKHRREFLGTLAAGAAALGITALANPLQLKANPAPTPADASNLDSWFGKINGKHKMVFDATQPHGVFPFAWPKVFLMTNASTGTPEKDCSAVVVLRHNAIGYAFEDRIWSKYKLGELFDAKDDKTAAAAIRNAFWQPKPGDFKIPGVGEVQIGINELQESGVMFCVCEMAMVVYTAVVADKMQMDPAEVMKDWKSAMLPGIQPVPSGVWAVGRAQSHGCAYCFAG